MQRQILPRIILFVAFLSGCESVEHDSHQDGFAPVDGGRLYYQIAGSGDTVVLIHGIAGDHRHWNNQFEQIAARFRVVRYDVRGWGQSSNPVIGSPYSDFSDLANLLDHIGVEKAHIVGWSMGSGIAFDFVTAYPNRAKSLVSVGPWLFGHRSQNIDKLYEQMGAVAKVVEESGAVAAVNAFVDIVLDGSILDESADEFIRSVGAESSFWTFANPRQSVSLKPNAATQLSNLTIPILVITAEHDLPACREMGDFIVTNAPNSKQFVVQNTGHLMHIEKPNEFNRMLLAFLGGLE